MVTKLKHSNYDKTQKLKWLQNSKAQIVTKLKNSNCDQPKKIPPCDENQKLKLWQNYKNLNCDETQKLKWWQNSNCDKTQKLKVWQNSKTHIVTKFKLWQYSNFDKSKVVRKLKLGQNSNFEEKKLKSSKCEREQIENSNLTILANSSDKTQKLKLWQNLKYDKSTFMKIKTLKESVSKHFLTPWQAMRCSLGSVLRFSLGLLAVHPPRLRMTLLIIHVNYL